MRCTSLLFGRLLGDPPFEKHFFANPVEVARELGATRAVAQSFGMLTHADFQNLSQQLAHIRAALGPETSRRLATDVGLQLVVGRALADPIFANRLRTEGAAAVTSLLGGGEASKAAMAFVASAEFRNLNTFQAQRHAMTAAGSRFSLGIAVGAAKAALRDSLLNEIQAEARANLATKVATTHE